MSSRATGPDSSTRLDNEPSPSSPHLRVKPIASMEGTSSSRLQSGHLRYDLDVATNTFSLQGGRSAPSLAGNSRSRVARNRQRHGKNKAQGETSCEQCLNAERECVKGKRVLRCRTCSLLKRNCSFAARNRSSKHVFIAPRPTTQSGAQGWAAEGTVRSRDPRSAGEVTRGPAPSVDRWSSAALVPVSFATGHQGSDIGVGVSFQKHAARESGYDQHVALNSHSRTLLPGQLSSATGQASFPNNVPSVPTSSRRTLTGVSSSSASPLRPRCTPPSNSDGTPGGWWTVVMGTGRSASNTGGESETTGAEDPRNRA